MAIAFVNSNATNSNSFSYTVGSGSNRCLVVFILHSDTVTGVTYNSVAMSSADSVTGGGANLYAYYLVNPASGSNTLSISHSGVGVPQVSISDWTGVAQSSTINDHNSQGFGTSTSNTISVTSTVVNVVALSAIYTAGSGISKSTGISVELGMGTSPAPTDAGYSSNASIGEIDHTWTFSSGSGKDVMIALAPAPVTASVSDTSTISENVTTSRVLSLILSETLTLTDNLVSMFRVAVASVSDTISLSDIFGGFTLLWNRLTKTASSWSNNSKNSSSFTNESPNSSSWTNESKNSSSSE